MRAPLAALAVLLALTARAQAAESADSQARRLIVANSIELQRVGGQVCTCPYQRHANGGTCSGRSAYDAAGRGVVLCFRGDVTPAMIDAWRKANP